MRRLRHVVTFVWTHPLSDDEAEQVRLALDSLGAAAGSVRAISHGPDVGAGPDRSDYAVVVDFDDVEGWQAYSAHPAHDPVRELLGRLTASSSKVQFWTHLEDSDA